MNIEHGSRENIYESEEHLSINESVNGVEYHINWIEPDKAYEIYFPAKEKSHTPNLDTEEEEEEFISANIIKLSSDKDEVQAISKKVKELAQKGMSAEEISEELWPSTKRFEEIDS